MEACQDVASHREEAQYEVEQKHAIQVDIERMNFTLDMTEVRAT